MKTLLLLGGMTPDVTKLYYDSINRAARKALGGRHNAPLFLYSANLEIMAQHATAGDWSSFAKAYTDPIETLAGKVDAVVVSAILAHKVTAQLEQSCSSIKVPLLHIADCVASHIKSIHPQISRLGLLGPKITMLNREDPDFFIGRLESPANGFTILVPETEAEIAEVNRGMMEEVTKGLPAVTPTTKAMFIQQANRLIERGAQGVILGSTDLGFVVRQEDLPDGAIVIEPGAIHAEEAAKWALRE
ncbi:Asp/Glu/hydantoin racemase [Xylariaceae sp. FL1019]|nr:Asp/Glu/hydantoin racemase [Xylariaceae sp. FL1019]